jgi:hypothetical protein
VVVGAATREAHEVVRAAVAGGERGEIRDDLHLGHALGELERPVQADGFGDLLEQLVDARAADGLEHPGHVVLGVRREPHAGRRV